MGWKKYFAVGAGGFVGALLRYGISVWIPAVDGFPWGILWINWSGCLFLGWFLTLTGERLKIRKELQLAIGTGFTGAYTTFSTFAVDTVRLLQQDQIMMAMLYVASSVIGGLALAYVGAKWARRGRHKAVIEGR